jgi:rod shape-determining protein MreC
VKNIFLFIRNYFTFLSFVVLLIFSIVLLSKSSKTHEAFFSSYSNELTGKINKQYNNLYGYFNLKQANERLLLENALLRNQLKQMIIAPDSTTLTVTDSTTKDTLNRYRKFTFYPANVVGNSVTLQNNFITLERGSKQGVEKGMSVISPLGVVGTVVDVSENYSRVMSLLHRNSKISAMLKNDNNAGSIEWDGKNPAILILKNIPKSIAIKIGDTVLTSSYSANYPSGIMVGKVAKKVDDPSSNFYTLQIQSATNFYTLQQVYIVKNSRFAEQTALENKPQKASE